MNQKQVAEKLGVTPSHISKIKKGGAVSESLLKSISRTFGFSEIWIKTGEGEMLPKPSIPSIGDQAQPVWRSNGAVPAIATTPTEEEVLQAYFIKKGLIPAIAETVNEELGKLDKSKQYIATGKILDLLRKIQDEEDREKPS